VTGARRERRLLYGATALAAAAAVFAGANVSICGRSGIPSAVCALGLVALAVHRLRRWHLDPIGLTAAYTALAVPIGGFIAGCGYDKFGNVPGLQAAGDAPLVIVTVFFLGALLANALAGAIGLTRRREPTPSEVSSRTGARFDDAGVDTSMRARWTVATLAGYGALLALASTAGTSSDFRSQFIQEGQGWLFWAGHLAIIGPPAVAHAAGGDRRSRRLALVLAIGTTVLFLLLGGRARAFLGLAATAVVLASHRRARAPGRPVRRRHRGALAFGGVLLAMLVLYVPTARGDALADLVTKPWEVAEVSVGRIGDFWRIDIDRSEELAAVASFFDEGSYLGGKSVGGVLGPFADSVGVSRDNPGRELFRAVNPDAARAIPAAPVSTLPGQGFIELGYRGVFAAGLAFGVLAAIARRFMTASERVLPLAAVVWAYTLFAFYTDASKVSALWFIAGMYFAVELGPMLGGRRPSTSIPTGVRQSDGSVGLAHTRA
jgi:hypothetical protein